MTDATRPTEQTAGRDWRAWLRVTALVALVLAAGWALVGARGNVEEALATTRRVIDGAGALGAALFVLVYAILTVLLVPGSPLTVAAGVLFGPYLGTALVLVGATLGATAAFVWGRWLGREPVARLAGDRFERVDAWLSERGLLAVLYVRLVPLVPFNVVNPVAGVTGIGLRDFVLGTAIGIVPGTFAYAALGGSFDDPTSPTALVALGLLVGLGVGAPRLDGWVRRNSGDASR